MRLICSVVLAGFLLTTAITSGQSKTAFIGAWQVVEVSANGVTQDRKQPGTGGVLVSTDRYFAFVDAGGAKPRPPLPEGGAGKASADDLRASWGPFNGWAGSYEWTGPDQVTSRYLATKNPSEMAPGAFVVSTLKLLDANTMTLQVVRNQAGPVPNAPLFKLVRVK